MSTSVPASPPAVTSSPRSSSPAEVAAVSEEEEIPLEIEDYSCASTFEQIVDDVERYLRQVFQSHAELHRFVFLRPRQRAVTVDAAPHAKEVQGSSVSLELSDTDLAEDDESLVSALSFSSSRGGASTGPLVVSRTFPLRQPRRRGLSVEAASDAAAPVDDITVEVHVHDATHPIGLQFQLPLFFLIRSVNREISYLATESTFYLSILATAVGNAFCSGQQYIQCTDASASLDARHDSGSVVHSLLATPFLRHRGCAPCFVPVGDSYQELFEGLAPPIAVPLSIPLSPVTSPQPVATPTAHGGTLDSSSPGLVAMLIGSPVLSTTYRSSAFAKIPNNCQYLSDFLDLFQLHIGQRSHVQTAEFDGICVSLWKQYALSVPWRFLPVVSPGSASQSAVRHTSAPTSTFEPVHLLERRATEGPTWPRILECDNELHRALCGPFTYPVGTSTPPVEDVRFTFSWAQLREMEAQESTRRTFLNPFAPSAAAAGEAVQRRACVLVQPRVREECKYSHYIGDKLRTLTDAVFKNVRSLVVNGASESLGDPTSGLTPEEMRKLTLKVLSIPPDGVSVAAQVRFLHRFVETAERGSSTVQDALADLARTANVSGGKGSHNPPSASGASASAVKDLRHGYFPGSFLSRFAHVCGEFVERPEDVFELWKSCVSWMKARLDQGGRDAIPQLLRCLALPESSVAVDLNQTLMVQKLQLLAYCLRTMLLTPHEKEKHVAELKTQESARSSSNGRPLDGWDEDDTELVLASTSSPVSPSRSTVEHNSTAAVDSARETAPNADDSFASHTSSTLTLITNGEPLVVPPSIPSPPMTTDTLLQRAKELNDLGTGRGAELTRTWLQSDALYNDMCLFLYVNKASQGRIVRFPDFIQWHSPRDFIAPTPGSANTATTSNDDNAYLSDRMQKREGGVSHVWWSLWERATPRSLEEIAANLFQEHEQAALVFRWLTSVVTLPTLLLEIVNASLANASHRLLSHRHVIGGTAAAAGGMDPAVLATLPAATEPIPELRTYLQEKCTTFTTNVDGAAAVFDAANTAAAAVSHSAVEMEVETVRTLYATAISTLEEMESAVCAAIAMENLLGVYVSGSEAALVVQRASAPVLGTPGGAALSLQCGATTFAVWASAFLPRFVLPQDRAEREMVARLTCLAERPLNTTGCFQQLVVQRRSDVLRLSLALTHEVL